MEPQPPHAPPTPPPLPGVARRPPSESLSPQVRARLLELELSRFWVVFWLALSSLVVATISLAPVVKRWVDPLPATTDWDRWVYLLLFFAVLHVAYVVLFVQLPHGFSLRSNAIFAMVLACVYAAGLATFTFSQADAQWVVWLDLADEQQRGTTQRWCLMMLCLLLPVAYYQGRISSQWRQQEAFDPKTGSSVGGID